MLVLSRKIKESVIVQFNGYVSLLTVVDFEVDGRVVFNWHDLSGGSCEEIILSQDVETSLGVGEVSFSMKVSKPSGSVASLGIEAPKEVRFLRAEARVQRFADAA